MPSLERMFENACTLRFSRLIVLMVGYLPLWVLISCTSSSPGFDLPYELYVRITARGESGFGSLLIDLVTEFMWSANAFKPPRILSLRVLSLINLKHKLLKRRPKQIITIKGNHHNHGVTVHKCIILVLASSPSYMWCSLIS